MTNHRTLDIGFDGPPGPVAPRFVEVVTLDGHGVNAGEWRDRGDGFWALRIEWRNSEKLPVGLQDAWDASRNVLAARVEAWCRRLETEREEDFVIRQMKRDLAADLRAALKETKP